MPSPHKRSFAAEQLARQKKVHPYLVVYIVILGFFVLIVGAYVVKTRFMAVREPETEQIRSIAVLPFADMSPEKDQDWFCEGVAERILNNLSSISNLKVPGRTSSFLFKGSNVNIPEIGKQLNVESVLEGSVIKSGNRLTITAQLINTKDGYHIWSERYDRQAEDVFPLIEEISLEIVDALKINLLDNEKTAIEKRYTENTEAYNLYLKGRYYFNKRTEEGLQSGINYFRQAINIDPSYALAYAGIADCYNMLGIYMYKPPKNAYPQAKSAAEKALEIDDTIAEAHTSLGWIRLFYDWDWPEARKEFTRAIELNPNYPTAHVWYAFYLVIMRQLDDAIAEVDRSLELDPRSVNNFAMAGNIRTHAHRNNDAKDYYHKALEIDPHYPPTYHYQGSNFADLNMYEDAVNSFQTYMDLTGGRSFSVGFLGYAYGMSGRKDKALELLKQLEKLSKERYVSQPYNKVLLYIGLGDRDNALKYLEQAIEDRESVVLFTHYSRKFDSVRDDVRFKALLKKIGLPEN